LRRVAEARSEAGTVRYVRFVLQQNTTEQVRRGDCLWEQRSKAVKLFTKEEEAEIRHTEDDKKKTVRVSCVFVGIAGPRGKLDWPGTAEACGRWGGRPGQIGGVQCPLSSPFGPSHTSFAPCGQRALRRACDAMDGIVFDFNLVKQLNPPPDLSLQLLFVAVAGSGRKSTVPRPARYGQHAKQDSASGSAKCFRPAATQQGRSRTRTGHAAQLTVNSHTRTRTGTYSWIQGGHDLLCSKPFFPFSLACDGVQWADPLGAPALGSSLPWLGFFQQEPTIPGTDPEASLLKPLQDSL
jgi:hypothetical protein